MLQSPEHQSRLALPFRFNQIKEHSSAPYLSQMPPPNSSVLMYSRHAESVDPGAVKLLVSEIITEQYFGVAFGTVLIYHSSKGCSNCPPETRLTTRFSVLTFDKEVACFAGSVSQLGLLSVLYPRLSIFG